MPGISLRRLSGLVGILLALPAIFAHAGELALDRIKLPPGFSIERWANVDNARQMALGKHDANGGTVFVGSMQAGTVHAVSYDANVQVLAVRTIARGLALPIGVAYRNGSLYVSAVSRILRYDNIDTTGQPTQPVVVTDKLPTETHHGGRFISFGPDGKLYIPVGAPCNICQPKPDRHAIILRMNPDGSESEIYARGVRNSVGFDWHPQTGKLWFTDNGRDLLGDDIPPDELNYAPDIGMHFGFPYCHGGDVADETFGARQKCAEFIPPAQKLAPHAASLGMRFYTGTMFPPQYRNQIFIAEHGSWNRSKKIGYRVALVRLQGDKAVSYETFASGWRKAKRPGADQATSWFFRTAHS